MEFKNRENTFVALTALWAFVESGLGGMMHAFHLPFTGIFLGGFSVLIISLIAYFEKDVFKQIIKATVIVLTVKLAVNPATSPFAYLAVGFQGLLGASLFSLPFRNLITCTLFALLAMLESAFQKLIILTLFLGKSWWTAIDIYYSSICKTFGFDVDAPLGLYMVLFYIFIYFIWGFLLGLWSFQLPLQVQERIHLYKHLDSDIPTETLGLKKKRKKWVFLLLAIVLFSATFFIEDKKPIHETVVLLTRTVLILSVWMLFIAPFIQSWVQKWLSKRKQVEMPAVLDTVSIISSKTKPLYKEVSLQFKGFKKWKEFVLGLVVISLNTDER